MTLTPQPYRIRTEFRYARRDVEAFLAATGFRIKVSDQNTAIDEIEVNPIADLIPPITNFIEIREFVLSRLVRS